MTLAFCKRPGSGLMEKYDKKLSYEFCELRNLMVRLEVIQVTVRMPDLAHAQLRLVPTNCNCADDCRRKGVKCLVYDPQGQDPCPDAWERQW